MYDLSGNIQFVKNFGGSGVEDVYGVTAVDGGLVIVGSAPAASIGNGTFTSLTAYGAWDGFFIIYDLNGNLQFVRNLSIAFQYGLTVVTAIDSGFMVLGRMPEDEIGKGVFTGLTGCGGWDGFFMIYNLVDLKEIEILSSPDLLAIEGNSWSYIIITDQSDVTITVNGASWLSSDEMTISGTAPTPLNRISETFEITITASKAGFESAVQTFILTIYAELEFITIPSDQNIEQP
jgi:hypothetical protein